MALEPNPGVRSRLLPPGSYGLAGTVGEISLHGVVYPSAREGEFSSADVRGALTAIGEVDNLIIDINCPGGHVGEGAAIMAILDGVKSRKIVFVSGMAFSYGSVFAMVAEPGQVYVYELAEMMVHEPWNITIGDAAAHLAEAGALDELARQIVGVYLRRPALATLGADGVRALMAAETTMTAARAVEMGFADRMVRSLHELAAPAPDPVEPAADPAEPAAEPEPETAVAFRSAHAAQLFAQFRSPMARAVASALQPAAAAREPRSPRLPELAPAAAAELPDLRAFLAPADRAAEVEVLQALPPELRARRLAQLTSRPSMHWARAGAADRARTALAPFASRLPPAAAAPAAQLLEGLYVFEAAGADASLLKQPGFAGLLEAVFKGLPESPLLVQDLVPATSPDGDPRPEGVRLLHRQAGLTDERYLELRKRHPNANW